MERLETAAALLLPLALLALLAPPAKADRLITEDGRVIELVKGRKEGDKYRLVFEHGEILAPDDGKIASIEMEGDMADYVPQNDDEKEKLADGFVKYQGKWMTKARYETERKKEFEEAKARTDLLAEHSDWHNAWTAETKHFLIRTNTSPELLEYYGDLLEAYYSLMDDRIGIKPSLSYRRKKITVNLYKSHAEFLELSAADVGPTTLGYWWSADDTLNFFHDYQDPELSLYVGLHECTHLLTFLIDRQYVTQIWLNEAVADYFGSSKVTVDERGKLEIEPGVLQTDRVLTVQQAIKDGDDTKLEELFFIDRNAYTGFHYAHGWSFAYFLHNGANGRYAKGFARFFRDLYTLKKGIPYESVNAAGPTGTGKRVRPEVIRDLLLKYIKVKDLDALEKEWKAFVKAIPIETKEARLKRGLRAVGNWEFKDAIEDLDAAIEAGIEDPRAWASRARAKAFTGGLDSALEDLKIAVEKDPLNAVFRNELSALLVGVRGTGSFRVSGGEDTFDDPEAKRQAGLAMELDPGNDYFRTWYQRFK